MCTNHRRYNRKNHWFYSRLQLLRSIPVILPAHFFLEPVCIKACPYTKLWGSEEQNEQCQALNDIWKNVWKFVHCWNESHRISYSKYTLHPTTTISRYQYKVQMTHPKNHTVNANAVNEHKRQHVGRRCQ